jgi:4-cresol dehydrogenase (hydroxylating)
MELLAGLPLSPASGPTLCRSQRRLRGRVCPQTAGDAAAVVRTCAERKWPLHPVSGGKNWGMGSYLPDSDDCVLLDLSGLKAIGPLDRDAAAVRIEAGVTQKELYDWLHREAPELAFNVTGAGKDTSIVGNAMERGLGYQGSRAHEFFGLEAVLADGTTHRPDPEWFSTTGNIPAGPQAEALFFQSNFGVVTAGWLKLRRRQEVEAAVVISGGLEAVFETVAKAYQRGVLTLPVHMAGNHRSDAIAGGLLRLLWGRTATMEDIRRVFPQSSQQTALGAVQGTRRMTQAALRELRSLARGTVKVRAITKGQLESVTTWFGRLGLRNRATFFNAIRPLLALTWGEPTDAGLASLGVSNPDQADEGCLYFSSVSTLHLAESQRIEALLKSTGLSYGLTRYFMAPDVLVHVISVHFATEERAAVITRVRALSAQLRAAGRPPYRLGVSTMVPSTSALIDTLKRAFDPNAQLSPGHYVA